MLVNGSHSAPFPFYRGAWQECPLFPPLAAAIQQSTSISGFWRGERKDKISLYAVDALTFLGDTNSPVSSLMSSIVPFGSFSGVVINREKSVPPSIIFVGPIKILSGPTAGLWRSFPQFF